MNKDTSLFIKHMLACMKDIESFTKGISKSHFLHDKLVQNAVIRSLEVIGEAAKNLPDEFTKKHPDIEWAHITGMRDKLIHNYFGVDLEIVWKVVKADLKILQKKLQNIDTSKGKM